ncbi:MAG: hypothetical protein LBU39_10030 [Desulfobulbaceae bacterium]|nr:hypothetical protein [Desulfobulbaceae bacterium]
MTDTTGECVAGGQKKFQQRCRRSTMERDYKAEAHAHWDFINKMAKKRFWHNVVAEEAALAVMDALAKDDWAVLKKYRGEASFAGFFRAVAVSELENFARKKFGRGRPPLWVTKLGGIWEKLHTALCRERFPLPDALEMLCVSLPAAEGDRKALEAAARQLLARIPDCGAFLEETPLEEAPELVAPSSPDRESERRERDEALTTVFELLLGGGREAVSHARNAFQAISISLSSEERLFLKMCYQDGLSVAGAGRMLGMGRFQAAARMRRLLERLRREFERVGLYQELLLLLQDGR